uniref:Uncharacterized protein n=1 Tax=Magnetospirillum gryphiswaldense TaxID=55518 RepID=A4TTU8_9PROT|nr:hypothetical protein MGR_1214 [Magnetospirillum gryphiswaldense MSR-1]
MLMESKRATTHPKAMGGQPADGLGYSGRRRYGHRARL